MKIFDHLIEISEAQEYELSRIREFAETSVYAVIAFTLPLFLGKEQLIVGSVVNALLFLAALNIRGIKTLPIIMFPSLGAFSAGLIFGPMSTALLYMIPFIWIGNSIIVFGTKYLNLKKKLNYAASVVSVATAKSVFLFATAFILFSFNAVPQAFLTSMGILQLVTALSGGALAYLIQYAKRKIA